MQGEVVPAVGAYLDDRRCTRGQRTLDPGTQLVRVPGALIAAAVKRGGVGEVQTVRRGDVLLEGLALAGDRQEVEDPAAVVVEQHDGQRQPEPAGGQQAPDVVREQLGR